MTSSSGLDGGRTVQVSNSPLYRVVGLVAGVATLLIPVSVGLLLDSRGVPISNYALVVLSVPCLALAATCFFAALPRRILIGDGNLIAIVPLRQRRSAALSKLRYEIYEPALAKLSLAVSGDMYVRVLDGDGHVVANAAHAFSTRSLQNLVAALRANHVPGDVVTYSAAFVPQRRALDPMPEGPGDSADEPPRSVARGARRLLKQLLVTYVLGMVGIVLLLTGLAIAGIVSHGFDPVGQWHLHNEGVLSQGVVTSIDPGNHGEVDFSYVVEGRSYKGVVGSGDLNPNTSVLRPGDPVRLAYLPSNPAVYCTCLPADMVRNSAREIVVFILVGGAMFGLFIFAVTEQVRALTAPWQVRIAGRPFRMERYR